MLLEIVGFVTGLVYLFLEIGQKRIMWVVGALSGTAYIIIFMNQGLYANMSVQIYYLLVSIYGWLCWGRLKNRRGAEVDSKANSNSNTNANAICYRYADMKILAWSFLFFVILSALLFLFLKFLDRDPMPFLDAATFSLSIIATWWLSRCIIDQWIVWVVTDVSIAVICFGSGLVLSGILYLLYSAFAVYGYFYWKKVGIRL